MTTRAARVAFAGELVEALPDEWAVYASPPVTVAAPAAILGPRDPYIERETARHWLLHLRLTLMVPLAAGAVALDLLDDAVDALRPTVLALAHVAWRQVGGLGRVNEGNVEYLLAAIDVDVSYDPTA